MIIINNDRTVTVPDNLKKIGVQYDNNAVKVTIQSPRYSNNIDMVELPIYVNYMRADKQAGVYIVEDAIIDPDDNTKMQFTWTLTDFATAVKGKLTFLVCVRSTNANGTELFHWNSELNKDVYISEGLSCTSQIQQENPDVIMWILTRLNTLTSLTSGADGFSPVVSVTETETGATISITDSTGTTIADISNGSNATLITGNGLVTTDGTTSVNMDTTSYLSFDANGQIVITIPTANSNTDGLLTSDDKKKLNAIHDKSNNTLTTAGWYTALKTRKNKTVNSIKFTIGTDYPSTFSGGTYDFSLLTNGEYATLSTTNSTGANDIITKVRMRDDVDFFYVDVYYALGVPSTVYIISDSIRAQPTGLTSLPSFAAVETEYAAEDLLMLLDLTDVYLRTTIPGMGLLYGADHILNVNICNDIASNSSETTVSVSPKAVADYVAAQISAALQS